jgi:hypothetical protein
MVPDINNPNAGFYGDTHAQFENLSESIRMAAQ